MARYRLLMRDVFLLLAIGSLVLVIPHILFAADDVPKITIQELKSKMDKGENILIIDVRSGEDYSSSKVKIKGAVRIPLGALQERQKELSQDSEIITYCA